MTETPAPAMPKGFDCTGCGKRHGFPAYVYAHWRDTITHTCDQCGMKHELLMGKARQRRRRGA